MSNDLSRGPAHVHKYSKSNLSVPAIISEANGIRIFGRVLRSFTFTTDIAVIKNINSDAIISMQPFVSQSSATRILTSASDMPVFIGIGSGTTSVSRMQDLAFEAECAGARGIVLNAAVSDEIIEKIRSAANLPVILTVASKNFNVEQKINAGVDIFNVSAAIDTPNVVSYIKSIAPSFPVIATGGPTDESIKATIDVGADAISYTPILMSSLFQEVMDKYRKLF